MYSTNNKIEPSDFRILIVDDNVKNIEVLGSLLQGKGYDIEYALDGITAIELLKNEYFDLVLLDIMMPKMDGYETCGIIKQMKNYKETPIIFLTAKTELASVIKGFEVGGVDYITKPFNSEELICRINTHLELQWKKKELARINSEKDKLYSIVAHDIKNPFTSLISTLELMELKYKNLNKEQLNEKFLSIKKEIELIVSSSTNLLQWASQQANIQKSKPETFLLLEAIQKELRYHESVIYNKKIKIIINISDNLSVYFDKEQFIIIVRNLISNALKFSFPENQLIIVAKQLKDTIELYIEDFGIGMPADIFDNLFVLSKKTQRLGTQNEKGSGLGILLVHDLLERNNGKMDIVSKENKATRFTLQLPYLF